MTVWNWEHDRTRPDLKLMPEVSAFLGYEPNHTPTETLSERIIAFRHRYGLSQRELAAQLGVDPCTVASWERGEHRPSPSLGKRLDAMLGGG